jgi:hypothetical protein
MGAFLGGLTGGIAKGMKDKEERGIVNRLKKSFGRDVPQNSDSDATGSTSPDTLTEAHKGGRIKKTGVYRMKKGEIVVPAGLVKSIEKRIKGKRTGVRKSNRRGSGR